MTSSRNNTVAYQENSSGAVRHEEEFDIILSEEMKDYLAQLEKELDHECKLSQNATRVLEGEDVDLKKVSELETRYSE